MVILSITFCLALVWVYFRAKKQNLHINTALDLSLVIMVSGFLGSRLFHVFYEEPSHYLEHPSHIFHFWHGGFVFYGGLLGCLLGAYIFLKLKRQNYLSWADFFAPIGALGYALGRTACLMNGCCYGELCDLPWAIEFTYPGLPSGHRHPTPLYASFWELGVFFILMGLEKLKAQKKLTLQVGSLFFTWLILHSLGRLVMEAFRDDPRGAEPFGLSVASWISMGIILASAFFIFYRSRRSQL